MVSPAEFGGTRWRLYINPTKFQKVKDAWPITKAYAALGECRGFASALADPLSLFPFGRQGSFSAAAPHLWKEVRLSALWDSSGRGAFEGPRAQQRASLWRRVPGLPVAKAPGPSDTSWGVWEPGGEGGRQATPAVMMGLPGGLHGGGSCEARSAGSSGSSRARHHLLEGGGWHGALLPSQLPSPSHTHRQEEAKPGWCQEGGNLEKLRKVNAEPLNKTLCLELRCALLVLMV